MRRYLASIAFIIFFPVSTALSLTSAEHMLVNFSLHVETIKSLVLAFAFFMGGFLIFRALLKLKIYGEMRTMMAPHARLNQVIIFLFTGALLMYLAEATVPVMLDAIFGNTTITHLSYDTGMSMSLRVQKAAKQILQLIGWVSLVRGIIQLTGQQEGGRSPTAKALTHIFAGVLAINVQQSINLLNSLFGL